MHAVAVLGWGQRGTGPPNLAQPPPTIFFQGKAESMMISIVIPLSRCCLPNDEGPAPPPKYVFLEPPLVLCYVYGIGQTV